MSQVEAAAVSVSSAMMSGPRLLVVDDNEDNRYTLTLQLELEGYQNIAAAEDGEEALGLLAEQEFDLVLLDVMMPKIDGYQVLQKLKAEGRLHSLPVIMISALNEIASVVRCIELGAEDYLPKPFDPVLLRARVGASLDKKRLRDQVSAHLARVEDELRSARELQMSMVPGIFPSPCKERPIEIFAMMEPAREVGGDLYDFFDGPDGSFCFLIGDVSGKGVPAALFMARTKNLVRLITRLARGADGAVLSPSEIIAMVNEELCQDNAAMMFVTLFFAMIRSDGTELQYCNAGHNPPYRLQGRTVEQVPDIKGRPLGLRAQSPYESVTLAAAPGDVLYLYSDGITEATDSHGALFSEQRLEAALSAAAGGSSNSIVSVVADAVQKFVGGCEQSDDITAMAVRFIERTTL
jgi:sigma-B regulation protein RsbU (phosphoserine phosphatase)